MFDPYDTGIPKYSTAQSIYDALCELVQTEEMSILSEIFNDVSWDNQTYYYTFNGDRLKEQFENIVKETDIWLLDLAIWQLDQLEIHDLVWEALHNPDLAKRLGFKKLFIDHMLRGNATLYNEAIESYVAELSELNRFDSWGMIVAYNKAMTARSCSTDTTPYLKFSHVLYEKASKLKLQKEIQLIIECRALLTSYDDFLFGLRANQHLYNQLKLQYDNKVLQLQASYEGKVKQLMLTAEEQGLVLASMEDLKRLPVEAIYHTTIGGEK